MNENVKTHTAIFKIVGTILSLSIILFLFSTNFLTCSNWKSYTREVERYVFPSLEGFPEPEREIQIILPPGYDSADEETSYPTIYCLHGGGSAIEAIHQLAENVRTKSEILYNAGQIKKMIVVIPHAGTNICDGEHIKDGSFYRNSTVTGNFKTMILDDLVDFVDGHYNTLASRDKRSIAGFSMGGYGAIMLSMESNTESTDDEQFSLVSSHSGLLSLEHARQTLANFSTDNESILAMAECLLTAMEASFSDGEALGLDIGSGSIDVNEEVWEQWLQNDPLTYLDTNPDALRNMAIYLDCGETDELGFKQDFLDFTAKLDEFGYEFDRELYYYDWTPSEWLNNFLSGHIFIEERIPVMLKWHSEHFE